MSRVVPLCTALVSHAIKDLNSPLGGLIVLCYKSKSQKVSSWGANLVSKDKAFLTVGTEVRVDLFRCYHVKG